MACAPTTHRFRLDSDETPEVGSPTCWDVEDARRLRTDRLTPYTHHGSLAGHRAASMAAARRPTASRATPRLAPSPGQPRQSMYAGLAKTMTLADIRRVQVISLPRPVERAATSDSTSSTFTARMATWSPSYFSPVTNQRTDAYGGSLTNRMRFLREKR